MSDNVPKQLEIEAQKAGMTEREYCISRIQYWKEMLTKVSEDFRELSYEEYEKKLEEEVNFGDDI